MLSMKMDYASHDRMQSRRACDLLLSRHIVVNIGSTGSAIYRITSDWHGEKQNGDMQTSSASECVSTMSSTKFLDMTHFTYDPGEITAEYVETLEQMASSTEEPKRKRIGAFLLNKLHDKQYTFCSDEYKSYYSAYDNV